MNVLRQATCVCSTERFVLPSLFYIFSAQTTSNVVLIVQESLLLFKVICNMYTYQGYQMEYFQTRNANLVNFGGSCNGRC
jgi:predicted membrane protein